MPYACRHLHHLSSGVNWVSLNGETGIEVANGDNEAYAEAIDTLVSDREQNKKYGDAGHQRVVEHFTIPKMLAAQEECYKEMSNMGA